MKRLVTRLQMPAIAGFLTITALCNTTAAQGTPGSQIPLETQNFAIPKPITDAWTFVNDVANQLKSKLPDYSLINEKKAGEYLNQGVKTFNYNSLNDVFQGIANWYESNINLANAPGFIDEAVQIVKRAFELFAELIRWIIGYL